MTKVVAVVAGIIAIVLLGLFEWALCKVASDDRDFRDYMDDDEEDIL